MMCNKNLQNRRRATNTELMIECKERRRAIHIFARHCRFPGVHTCKYCTPAVGVIDQSNNVFADSMVRTLVSTQRNIIMKSTILQKLRHQEAPLHLVRLKELYVQKFAGLRSHART